MKIKTKKVNQKLSSDKRINCSKQGENVKGYAKNSAKSKKKLKVSLADRGTGPR